MIWTGNEQTFRWNGTIGTKGASIIESNCWSLCIVTPREFSEPVFLLPDSCTRVRAGLMFVTRAVIFHRVRGKYIQWGIQSNAGSSWKGNSFIRNIIERRVIAFREGVLTMYLKLGKKFNLTGKEFSHFYSKKSFHGALWLYNLRYR